MERQPSVCERRTFENLNPELYDFAQDVRTALCDAIEKCAGVVIGDANGQVVRTWAFTLGPLMWDVGGSILLLLSHGDRRAPAILNRCVFEYQLRLRYYMLKPDKAREAIKQMPERFRKIMRADPTWKQGRE